MSFSRPVIAFALLKQSGEAIQGDLLSGITILIRPLVTDLSGRTFDSKVLSERMAISYGMDVPATVLEDFAYSAETGHPFRRKLDTHSGANWTPVPDQTGHLGRDGAGSRFGFYS